MANTAPNPAPTTGDASKGTLIGKVVVEPAKVITGQSVFVQVCKHLGDAVDKVRRKENKTLKAAGDDRLAGTRYDWLKNPASMEPKDRQEFAELRNSELKTARAWALKETAMRLYEDVYERPARKHFRWWHNWAVRSRLQPMIEVARMLQRRFENIITYLRHRITNASSESINAKIQWVKYTARGFRNRSDNDQHVNFIGTDAHVHELYIYPGAGWVNNYLTQCSAGGVLSQGNGVSTVTSAAKVRRSHKYRFSKGDSSYFKYGLAGNIGSDSFSRKMGSRTLLVVLSLFALFFLQEQRAFAEPTYNQIRFVIQTGGDDLRGNSTADAHLFSANGVKIQDIPLKDGKQGSWDNNTTHAVTETLKQPVTATAIGKVNVSMESHNGFTQTDDNWNVQAVTITLLGPGGALKELMYFVGDPLARLTHSNPSFTIPEEPIGAPGTFNTIEFAVKTGGDDLRGNSSASITLRSPNGNNLQELTLKAKDGGHWENNSEHTVQLSLKPQRTPCQIGHIWITLTSHNAVAETDDNWNVQDINISVSNNGVNPQVLAGGSGDPLQRLTGSLPTLVVEGPDCMENSIKSEAPTGPLRGFVDLHTHPLSNLAFGGKVIYGGVDIGSLLPADPDCHKNIRAANMQQALGHDGSTHGSFGVGIGIPVAGTPGNVGVSNSCGDALRELVIHITQTDNRPKAANESSDARGAPDFAEWPVWNDITHQRMWVDWIHRAYLGGLRVMVALAVNNKTIGDMTAGGGDYRTDDKDSADIQIAETKAFVLRHKDFMEVASSPEDLERIVRANKLAVVLGVEIDNIGNFAKVHSLTNAAISAEIDRLFNEGVRYVFPIHLIDNAFGGTALYQDLFNYSNYRESGHWWSNKCDPTVSYNWSNQGSIIFNLGVEAKLNTHFSPPKYTNCIDASGMVNSFGLTPQGQFAIREMMRHGMLIDIDHMSDLSQSGAITVAKSVPGGYPLNSGHSSLRTPGGTERNMSHYGALGELHGMAALGTNNVAADAFVKQFNQMIDAVSSGTPGPIGAIGTDTDGMAMGMPPRKSSMVLYDDNFPRSSAGTRFWDYNDQSNNGKYGGVAHYGMIYDFLKDVSTLPAPGGYPKTGAQVVNNLMQGADYFFQTWKKCEQLKTQVDSIAVSASAPQRPAPAPQRPASSSPTYSGTWVEVRPQSGPATRLSLTQRGSQVEVRISYTGTFSGKVFGVASIQSNNSATWTVPQSCAAEFRKPGYSYDNPGESLFSLSLGEPIDGGSPEPILTYTQDTKWNVPCDGHPIGTKHTSKALQRAAPDKQ